MSKSLKLGILDNPDKKYDPAGYLADELGFGICRSSKLISEWSKQKGYNPVTTDQEKITDDFYKTLGKFAVLSIFETFHHRRVVLDEITSEDAHKLQSDGGIIIKVSSTKNASDTPTVFHPDASEAEQFTPDYEITYSNELQMKGQMKQIVHDMNTSRNS